MKSFLVAGLCLALVACPSREVSSPKGVAHDRRTYLIGALYPMTGAAARYGEDSKIAAQMAADEINGAGGINGRKIEILFRDDQANPDRARQLATEYILADRVDVLMGVVSSSAALVVTALSQKHKKIFVGTDHASSKLTYEQFQPYYFRVSNNTYQSMSAQAQFAAGRRWKRYFVIGPDYEYGHALWDDFKQNMQRQHADLNVVGEAWPKLFEPDYSTYISAIRAARPDVVVVNFWGGDMITFVKQAGAQKLFDKVAVLSCDAGGNYEVFEALGDQVPLGLFMSARHHDNWPPTEGNRAYVEAFHKRSGRYPTYAAEGAYVGVKFIAEGLRAHPDASDADGLVKALESVRIRCPEDPDGFVSYIDPATHQIVQVQAIGVTTEDHRFPPATRMLSDWKTYPAESLIPPPEEVTRRRKLGK